MVKVKEKKQAEESVDNKDDIPKVKTSLKPTKTFSKNELRQKSREFSHRQFRIIARNLSYSVSEKSLTKHFSPYGTLEEVNILKRPDGKLVGCAFLQYSSREEMDKAIEGTHEKLFMGRKIMVKPAVDKDSYQKCKKEPIKEELKEEENGEDEGIVDEEEEAEEEDEKAVEMEVKVEEEIKPRRKNAHLDDIPDGCTVFMKNIPYSINEEELEQVLQKFGQIDYVILNREKVSQHSKGTAFIKFKVKESADMCIKQTLKLKVGSQVVEIIEALRRKEIRDKEKLKKEKQVKDSRNLYLLKEGIIMAGSEAAKGVSQSDMAQRLRLEQRNAQNLKNLNRFLSRERLTIHNLPAECKSKELRDLVKKHTTHNAKECRVMVENQPSFGHPSGRSKGYGFVSFKTHEIALSVLRKLNNNPDVFGRNTRPIVAFSIEDKNVHNIKKERLQKSLLNNPTYQAKLENIKAKNREKFKKKKEASKAMAEARATLGLAMESDKKIQKPAKKERQRDIEKETEEFTGEISKIGKIGIRSQRKIKHQAEQHTERLKSEKKSAKKVKLQKDHDKMRKEKSKNAMKTKKKDEMTDFIKEDRIFTDTVGKYKNIINHFKGEDKQRSKWYVESTA